MSTKVKALCVATRCVDVGQFVATFHRFCDADSFFVSTTTMRSVGLETPFAVQLADGSPVLRGLCIVRDAWATPVNPYGRPGIRLGIVRLTRDSTEVFAKLRARRAETVPPILVTTTQIGAAPVMVSSELSDVSMPAILPVRATPPSIPITSAPPPPPVAPPPPRARPDTALTVNDTAAEHSRTPGSEYILPANPLMNLTDDSLRGFVDCTMYEETGEVPLDDAEPVTEEPAPADFRPISVIASPSSTGARTSPDGLGSEIASGARTASPLATAPEPLGEPLGEPPPAFPPLVVAAPTITTPRLASEPSIPPPPATEWGLSTPVSDPRPRWWLVALPVGIAVAIIAVIVIARSGKTDDANAEPVAQLDRPSAVAPPAQPTSDSPPPGAPTPAIASAAGPAEDEPTSGPPRVGKGPCKISIVATPADSLVQIDGEAIGPAPLVALGPCQKRKVELSHARYQNAVQWVTPEPDKPAEVDLTLSRPTHSLTVVTQPAGVTVSIDGRRAGTTPTIVKVMGFQSLTLTLEKPGFHTLSRRVYSKQVNDSVAIRMTNTLFPKPQ